MKRIKSLLLTGALILIPAFITLAQVPPHPGGDPSGTNAAPVGGVPGGGAPIGNGGTILVILALAYGALKYARKDVIINEKFN